MLWHSGTFAEPSAMELSIWVIIASYRVGTLVEKTMICQGFVFFLHICAVIYAIGHLLVTAQEDT
jgi:hypothetical protein